LVLGSNFVRSLVRDMVADADDLEIVGELDDEQIGAQASADDTERDSNSHPREASTSTDGGDGDPLDASISTPEDAGPTDRPVRQ
jgi:hypothetical protein